MGNIVSITDKNGNEIAEASHSLASYVYFCRVAARYNKEFEGFVGIDRINEELEVVYQNATPEDEVVILTFMNDKNTFTEEHIPHFRKAVEQYPENAHEGPKRVLAKMLALIERHGEIRTQYVGTTAAFAVSTA